MQLSIEIDELFLASLVETVVSDLFVLSVKRFAFT